LGCAEAVHEWTPAPGRTVLTGTGTTQPGVTYKFESSLDLVD
jgi:hypothetical protein